MAKSAAMREEAVRVGAKFQVTIPRRISKALRLKKGDHMLVRLIGQRVEMVPANLIPKDQAWFWTPEWQKKEREVDEALARGDFKVAESVEQLLNDLKS
ncbi:MAG TPA: AbrB/MazE/SpoVT family DNA-binding domain-containing protein [Terriglobia bacterium]|nr:AbrB/MazE/SpoVT family DNA-binding domain-containing protein [Terriglobia bacterium]